MSDAPSPGAAGAPAVSDAPSPDAADGPAASDASSRGAVDAPTEEANQASYEEISSRCRKSIDLSFSNQFKEATAVLDEALELARQRPLEFPEEPNLEAFALIFHAFSAFMQGISQMQNNQRDMLLEKMSQVEELAEKGPDWPGRLLMQAAGGFSSGHFLVISGTLLQKGQGAWKMVRSLGMLRGGTVIKDASEYGGRERGFLRPIALYINAVANLGVSMLPPFLLSAAAWLTSFSGDRAAALRDLEALWREDGMLAPHSADALLGQYMDVYNVGLEPTADQKALVDEIIKWVNETFPNSVVFALHRAIYQGKRRDLESAYAIGAEVLALGGEYPAMALAAHGMMGRFKMGMLQWREAAEHFRQALTTLKAVKRRAGSPECAVNAALCYAMAGDGAAVGEMMATAREYTKEKKKDWPEPDQEAFRIAENAPDCTKEGAEPWRPVRLVLGKLIFWWNCLSWMALPTAEECIQMLNDELDACTDVESKLMVYALLSDAYRQLDAADRVLDICEQALALFAAEMRGRGAAKGAVPALCYNRAWACAQQSNLSGARDALRKYHACGKRFEAYRYLSARVANLERRIGVDSNSNYKELKIPARRTETVLRELKEGDALPSEVSWDFVLLDYTVTFRAYFKPKGARPDSDSDWTELQNQEQWPAVDGAVEGSFEPPGPGTLKLEFDNSFSWMRSKTVIYQIDPPLEDS